MRWITITLLFWVQAFGQDSIDTTQTHSFKKAMLFSAVVPGSGQIYNHIAMPKGQKKAFWKVPLIYSGLGVTGYYILKNNALKNDLRSEYDWRLKGNDASSFTEYDTPGLQTAYVTARNNRDLFFLGFGVVYLLNVIDAGVEAHFVNFDVSENLELSFAPTLNNTQGLGVGLTLNFK